MAEGRLDLVDEWLQELSEDSIKQNSRLSLLYGEACGIRGDWERALESLERARTFFARKGDRRLESLACLKLSTVYSNYGDPHKAIAAAEAGLDLVPSDAVATRLRLEGNLAITRTWLTGALDEVASKCQRIAEEASALGLEHFAAIAHINAGHVLNRLGHIDSAVRHLERAAEIWAELPTSPFADNSELVIALVAAGNLERARGIASEAMRRTAPWPRPQAEAIYGQATVFIADGRFDDAIGLLERARANSSVLGSLHAPIYGRMIEALYLDNRPSEIRPVAAELREWPPDPRFFEETAAARAIAVHTSGECRGECMGLRAEIDGADNHGASLTALTERVKLGGVALSHRKPSMRAWAWGAVASVAAQQLWPSSRVWLRRYAAYAATALRQPDGAALLAALSAHDPDGWRGALVTTLPLARGNDRAILIAAVGRIANRHTLAALEDVPGDDVAGLRRQLRFLQAPRLFVRTLGAVRVHRSSWEGPVIPIEKRRARMLLAVLAAHFGSTLSRDTALDMLWPDADPVSAINSLNQTVFQLRRYIDPSYRGGESAEYIMSTADSVSLNPDLVHTDVMEIQRLPSRLVAADWRQRQNLASRAATLVRGEFLADFKYEDWVNRQQLAVHGEIRERLLSVARAAGSAFEVSVSAQAAMAILALDPYDEDAVLALAECYTQSGRRAAAKSVVLDFVSRLESDLELTPSSTFSDQARRMGAINSSLTDQRPIYLRG